MIQCLPLGKSPTSNPSPKNPIQEARDWPLVTHLHDKSLVVAAPSLRDELILEATPLLIKLHNWVLAMLSQDRPLLFYVLRENTKENQQTQLQAIQTFDGVQLNRG